MGGSEVQRGEGRRKRLHPVSFTRSASLFESSKIISFPLCSLQARLGGVISGLILQTIVYYVRTLISRPRSVREPVFDDFLVLRKFDLFLNGLYKRVIHYFWKLLERNSN